MHGFRQGFQHIYLASACRSVATLPSYQNTEGLLLHSNSNAPAPKRPGCPTPLLNDGSRNRFPTRC